jgi:hypothetical protein
MSTVAVRAPSAATGVDASFRLANLKVVYESPNPKGKSTGIFLSSA